LDRPTAAWLYLTTFLIHYFKKLNMRKISILAAGFLLMAFASKAQCDVKTTWTASKTEFIKSSGEVQSKPGTVTVTIDKENVSVVTADGEEELTGSVTDYVCDWKDTTNGTISFKSEVKDKQGEIRHATITIQAKDGKTTIMLEATEEETKIRLPIDNYAVAK
jgi:hypothetical protein